MYRDKNEYMRMQFGSRVMPVAPLPTWITFNPSMDK